MTSDQYVKRINIESIAFFPQIDVSGSHPHLVVKEEKYTFWFAFVRDTIMKPMDEIIGTDWSILVLPQLQDKPAVRMTIMADDMDKVHKVEKYCKEKLPDMNLVFFWSIASHLK